MDNQEMAALKVLGAIVITGPNPEVHKAAIASLWRDWPTLANALSDLADCHGAIAAGAELRRGKGAR